MLSSLQKNHLLNIADHYIQHLSTHLSNKNIKKIDINFDLTGSTWGMYVNRHYKRRLRLNPVLCSHYYKQCEEVIAHEVAHYAVDIIYGAHQRHIKPHGNEWKQIMQLLGFDNASATYKEDISQLPLKRQQRFQYRCNCKDHQLSTTRHNRVLFKGIKYYCNQCKSALKQSNPALVET